MSELDRPLFSLFHIGISIHHMNKRSERRLGLSLVQWCILKHLVDMPATSAYALAKAAGVHPSTLTQTLKRLDRKKYIFITDDPTDSRKKLISLTRSGKGALDIANETMSAWSHDLSSLGVELSRVNSFLQKQISDGL